MDSMSIKEKMQKGHMETIPWRFGTFSDNGSDQLSDIQQETGF